MRANWFGLAGERVYRLFGRIGSSEIISGIPGSPTEQYGVPYSLTEEFVAVYRMHPLVPDDYSLRSGANDQELMQATLRDLAGANALDVAQKVGVGGPAVLVRYPAPRAGDAAQLPEVPAGVRPPGWQPAGHRRDGHPAVPRAGRAALQRVPQAAAPRPGPGLRRSHRQSAMGPGDRADLPREHRGRRPDRGGARGAPADRVRLQRHRVPHLHPDGVAAPEQRPVLHHRLHPGGLYPGRDGLDQRQQHGDGAAAALPAAASRDRCAAERFRALGPRGAGVHPARPEASAGPAPATRPPWSARP